MFVTSIGSHYPGNAHTNSDLLAYLERYRSDIYESVIGLFTGEKSILPHIGVERRHCIFDVEELFTTGSLNIYQSCSEMACESAVRCLGGITGDSFDYLIAVSNTQDYILPGLSSIMMERLRERGISPTIDHFNLQGMGCTGLVSGLQLGRFILSENPGARILLTVAEANSSYIGRIGQASPSDPRGMMYFIQYFLFGDGAASLLLSSGPGGIYRVGASHRLTNMNMKDLSVCMIPQGGSRNPEVDYRPDFFMDRNIGSVALGYCERIFQYLDSEKAPCGGRFMIHTGSSSILRAVASIIRTKWGTIDEDFLKASYAVLADYGNLSAVSLPSIMERVQRENLLAPGDGAVMVGFGAGFSAGIVVLEHPPA